MSKRAASDRVAGGTARRVALICGCVSHVAACAGVSERESIEDRYLRTELVDTAPSGPVHHAAEWRFDGDALAVSVDTWQTCQRESARVVERTRVTTRTLDPDLRPLYGLGAVALLGAGSFLLASGEPAVPSDDVSLYDTEVAAGITGAGGLALLMVAVESLRQRDRREPVGEVRIPSGTRSPFACNEGVAVAPAASLSLPGGRRLEAPIVEGQARFDLSTVRASGIEAPAVLTVGGRSEPVSLLPLAAYRTSLRYDSRFAAAPPPMPPMPGVCGWVIEDSQASWAVTTVDEFDEDNRVVSSSAYTADGSALWETTLRWDDDRLEMVRTSAEPLAAGSVSALALRDVLGPYAPVAFRHSGPVAILPRYGRRGEIRARTIVECSGRRCDDDDLIAVVFESSARSRCSVPPGMVGCPTWVEWVDSSGVRQLVAHYQYDARDRLVRVTYGSIGGSVATATFGADLDGRIVEGESSELGTISWEYDASGNVLSARVREPENAFELRLRADYSCWGVAHE